MEGYEYGNTRVRVMKSRLLKPDQIMELAHAGGIDRWITSLSRTSYQRAVEAAVSMASGMACVPIIFRRHLAETLKKIPSFYSDRPGQLIRLLFLRYSNNNPVNYTDPSGHCAIGTSPLDPLSIFTIYASCVQDVVDAYKSYQSGETRLGVLYLEATGIKDALISTANAVNQMNSDVSAVFSSAPLKERILPSIRVGTFAVGTAATIVGVPAGRATASSAEISATESTKGILANKKAGDAFRDEIADLFSQAGYNVEKEVVKSTPFGPRRIDIEVTSPQGNILGGIETKLGGSRYLASQRAKDAWLQMQGYIVNLVRNK